MAKRSKFLFAFFGIAAGIIIGILWVTLNQQDFISEDEARAVVTERYGGEVDSVSLTDDDRYFVINLKGNSATHSIKVDREDSSVVGIETVSESKDTEQTAENTDSKETSTEEKDKADSENKDKTSKENQKSDNEKDNEQTKQEDKAADEADKETAEKQPLTAEEAINIAAGEVGGVNVYSTWNGDGTAREYYILQQVNDEDEGALVSINGATGHINKVVWLEIDDDYEEMEQRVYEAAQYANMYDSRYIEYDDEYFDDDDGNDDDDYDDGNDDDD